MKIPFKLYQNDLFKRTELKILLMTLGTVFVCLILFAGTLSLLYSQSVNAMDAHRLEDQKRFVTNVASNASTMTNLAPAKIETTPPQPKPNESAPVVVSPMPFENLLGNTPPPANRDIIMVAYKDRQMLLMDPNPFFSATNLPNLSTEVSTSITSFTQDGSHFKGITFEGQGLTFQAILNVDSSIRAINALNQALIWGLLLLLIAAAIASRVLTSRLIVPVRTAYEDQIQFIQDASHEMRTPLAVIKSAVDLMIRKPETPIGNQSEQISQMLSEIRNLEQLNTHLLMLSKEVFKEKGPLATVDLLTFFSSYVSYYEDLAELQDKTFKLDLHLSTHTVQWDLEKMKRMITLLLENAFKYTHSGAYIILSVHNDANRTEISVEDTGIGMSDDDQKKIFQRFYRSPNVRGMNIDGSGIGLSLLKAMSETLGVLITVQSKLGSGSTFTLSAPNKM